LCGIEDSWLYTFHNFYTINNAAKINIISE
jgi:hypothetical protein